MSPDPTLEALTESLARRQAILRRYLKIRAGLGVLLMLMGLFALAAATGIALHAAGAWFWPPLEHWTQGFSAVLATFMPSALGFICVRTGWSYWRHRHVEDPDTGCLAS